METPNTRLRRKRELENSSQEDGLKIAWVHDSQIRKAVLLAVEDDEITPPAPTQCPRPISSILKSSSSSSNTNTASGPGSVPSSSKRPPRKRPCRAHRSLPLPSSVRNGDSSLGPSSLPSMSILSSTSSIPSMGTINGEGEREKTRLDYLLDRFSLLSSPMDDEKSSSKRKDYIGDSIRSDVYGNGSGSGMETPSRNLRPRSHGTKPTKPMMFTSTPLKKKSTNPNISPNEEYDSPIFTTKPKEIVKPTSIVTVATNASSASSRNPLSPIKGGAPRIGLGSQHQQTRNKPSITSNRTGGWTRTNSGKAFRTPFLESNQTNVISHGNLGVRSSPRKHNSSIANRDRDGGPVRGPSLPASSTNTTNHNQIGRTTSRSDSNTDTDIHRNANTNIRNSPNKRPFNLRSNTSTSSTSRSSSSSLRSSLPPTPKISLKDKMDIKEFTNFDVGENDPEDTSFDSFDGIFATGGEEIERLLRRVDGSD